MFASIVPLMSGSVTVTPRSGIVATSGTGSGGGPRSAPFPLASAHHDIKWMMMDVWCVCVCACVCVCVLRSNKCRVGNERAKMIEIMRQCEWNE